MFEIAPYISRYWCPAGNIFENIARRAIFSKILPADDVTMALGTHWLWAWRTGSATITGRKDHGRSTHYAERNKG